MQRLGSVAATALTRFTTFTTFTISTLPAALLLAACAFEGSSGARLSPDAEVPPDAPDAMVDAAPDGPARVSACAGGFKVIGSSSYLQLPATVLLNWGDAFNRCPLITGAHLATFESPAEVEAVKTGLPLTASVWTGVAQISSAPTAYQGWFNNIGGQLTTIPIGFPWRAGEPNDGAGPAAIENNGENAAELQASGTFDDGPLLRVSRVLCECALAP